MTRPKHKLTFENVYWLGYYLQKKRASTERHHHHGLRAYQFQDQILSDENACYEKGICPMCGLSIAHADDCDDQESRR